MLPHSLLFGHLPIFADFRKTHPPDVNIYMFHTWLAENCKNYFPGLDYPPPVVYLDLWPIAESLAMVNDPVVASQFTVVQSLPKNPGFSKFLGPLMSGIDIVCTEGQIWKTWRSRFSPGFSQRNLTAILPEVIEEANVFCSLKALEKWLARVKLGARCSNLRTILPRCGVPKQYLYNSGELNSIRVGYLEN